MRDKAAACIFLDRLRFRSRRAFLGYIRGRVQAGCLYIFSVGWQGSSRGGEDSCRRKQLLIRLSIGDCNSNLNWRSRRRRRRSLRNFVTAEYFQSRRSRWPRGESIKGKSFSFTSAVPRRFRRFLFPSLHAPLSTPSPSRRPLLLSSFRSLFPRATLRFLRNVSWLARRSFHAIIRSTGVSLLSLLSRLVGDPTLFDTARRLSGSRRRRHFFEREVDSSTRKQTSRRIFSQHKFSPE